MNFTKIFLVSAIAAGTIAMTGCSTTTNDGRAVRRYDGYDGTMVSHYDGNNGRAAIPNNNYNDGNLASGDGFYHGLNDTLDGATVMPYVGNDGTTIVPNDGHDGRSVKRQEGHNGRTVKRHKIHDGVVSK